MRDCKPLRPWLQACSYRRAGSVRRFNDGRMPVINTPPAVADAGDHEEHDGGVDERKDLAPLGVRGHVPQPPGGHEYGHAGIARHIIGCRQLKQRGSNTRVDDVTGNGSEGYCSPRTRMQFNSRLETMAWRAISNMKGMENLDRGVRRVRGVSGGRDGGVTGGLPERGTRRMMGMGYQNRMPKMTCQLWAMWRACGG